MGQLLSLDCRWLTEQISSGNLHKMEKKKSNTELEIRSWKFCYSARYRNVLVSAWAFTDFHWICWLL